MQCRSGTFRAVRFGNCQWLLRVICDHSHRSRTLRDIERDAERTAFHVERAVVATWCRTSEFNPVSADEDPINSLIMG